MIVFKPRTSAWLVLFFICAPIIGLGVLGFVEDRASWFTSTALVAGGLAVVAYNATLRLELTSDEVRLKRYGRTVWQAPVRGTKLLDGRGGEPAVLPAHVLCRDGEKVGYILKSWFDEKAVAHLRIALNG
jgi:hypothetical protein